MSALVLALAGSGGDAAAQPAGPGCPNPGNEPFKCAVVVDLVTDSVIAAGFTPDTFVRIEIFDAAGVPRFTDTRRTNSGGYHVIGPNQAEQPGHGLDLVGGERVVVTEGPTVKTLQVSPLAVTAVNVGADTVTGRAGDGDRLTVSILDPATGFWRPYDVPVEPDGDWTADLSGKENIGLGTAVWAQVVDLEVDVTRTHPVGCPTHFPLECSVSASIEGDSISVFAFTPNSDITLKVFDPGGAKVYESPAGTRTDVNGRYHIDFGLNPGDPDLVPQSRVVVTDVATLPDKTLDLIPLSLESVDPGTGVVTVRAPQGTKFSLGAMNRQLPGIDETVGPFGTSQVDLGARGFTITAQDWFTVFAHDVDWDQTKDDLGAPVPGCVPDADTVCGSAGEDTLRVGGGGGGAFGLLRARRGFEVKAGLRNDTILFRLRRSGRVTIDAGSDADGVLLDPRANPRSSSLVVVNGRSGNDTVILPARAGSLKVRVVGGSGDDQVRTRRFAGRGGSRGSYRLEGGTGNDRLAGGTGKDVLIGGPGRDTCFKGKGDTVRSCEIVRRGQ